MEDMSLRLTMPEAWNLAALLTASEEEELLSVGRRLEQQLKDIQEARKGFQEALARMRQAD